MSKPLSEIHIPPLEASARVLPNHPEIWEALCEGYYRLREYDLALAAFEKASNLKEPKEKIWQVAADIQYEQENYPKADFALRQLSQFRALDFLELAKLGYCLQNQGQYAEARDFHYQAYLLQNENVWNITHLAYCFQALKQKEEALNYYLKAHRLEPKDDITLLNLGWLYLNKREFSKSRLYSKKCLESNPKSSFAQMNLAHSYLMEQKEEKAILHYKKSFILFKSPEGFEEAFRGDFPDLLELGLELEKLENIAQVCLEA